MGDKTSIEWTEGVGFSFFLFQFGDGGWLSYISNIPREDVVKALEEWLSRNRHGEQDILEKGH